MGAAFRAENIEQHYGRRRILTSCTLEAAEGECIGVAGRNGSGKSTLLQILAGVRRPAGGSLTFRGKNLLASGSGIGSLVAYVPQTNPLIEELSARENLQLLAGRKVSHQEEICQKLQLEELFPMKVSRMSGGMKRRVAIACALTEHPPVLVMDEPTSALDLYQREIIMNYLATYRQEGGIIVMATHDIEEMAFCDRLYLIRGGTSEECLPEYAVKCIKGEREL